MDHDLDRLVPSEGELAVRLQAPKARLEGSNRDALFGGDEARADKARERGVERALVDAAFGGPAVDGAPEALHRSECARQQRVRHQVHVPVAVDVGRGSAVQVVEPRELIADAPLEVG
jgi:hypothetical protein